LIQSSRNARIAEAPEYARAAVEAVFDSSAATPRLFKNCSSETLSSATPASDVAILMKRLHGVL
jgi:hypothetical protein